MSHEISFNKNQQAEAVFGYNSPAWHGYGKVFPEAIPFEQIFAIAFPFQAIQEPLYYQDGRPSQACGIYRSDTKKELGVHGAGYGVLQPQDLFGFCRAFFIGTQIPISSAIAMRGGAVLALSARLTSIDILNSGDITQSYLIALNSYDGSKKAQFYVSYTRPVCMNTVNISLQNQLVSVSFKHTKHIKSRVQDATSEAQKLMALLEANTTSITHTLETLARRKITHRDTYTDILNTLFPGTATRSENIKKHVTALWQDNDSNQFPQFQQTAYSLFQAVTNYVDHYRSTRQTDQDTTPEQARFESAQIGSGADLKTQALELILTKTNGLEETTTVSSVPAPTPTPGLLDTILNQYT